MSAMPGCPVSLCLSRDGYGCSVYGCHALYLLRHPLRDGQPHGLPGVSDATLDALADAKLIARAASRTGRPVWASPAGRRLGAKRRAAA